MSLVNTSKYLPYQVVPNQAWRTVKLLFIVYRSDQATCKASLVSKSGQDIDPEDMLCGAFFSCRKTSHKIVETIITRSHLRHPRSLHVT